MKLVIVFVLLVAYNSARTSALKCYVCDDCGQPFPRGSQQQPITCSADHMAHSSTSSTPASTTLAPTMTTITPPVSRLPSDPSSVSALAPDATTTPASVVPASSPNVAKGITVSAEIANDPNQLVRSKRSAAIGVASPGEAPGSETEEWQQTYQCYTKKTNGKVQGRGCVRKSANNETAMCIRAASGSGMDDCQTCDTDGCNGSRALGGSPLMAALLMAASLSWIR